MSVTTEDGYHYVASTTLKSMAETIAKGFRERGYFCKVLKGPSRKYDLGRGFHLFVKSKK